MLVRIRDHPAPIENEPDTALLNFPNPPQAIGQKHYDSTDPKEVAVPGENLGNCIRHFLVPSPSLQQDPPFAVIDSGGEPDRQARQIAWQSLRTLSSLAEEKRGDKSSDHASVSIFGAV